MTISPADRVDGRRAKGDLRRQAMIDAAREVFIACGYRGATLSAIIAKAGGSRETIYKAFGGKDGLFGAIIKQSEDELIASVPEMQTRRLPPREILTRYGLKLAEIWRSPEGEAVNRLVLSEGLHSPELMSAWYNSGPKPSLEALAAYLSAEHGAGRLKVADPQATARQFMFLLMGALMFPHMVGETSDPASAVPQAVDLILAGAAPERAA